MSNIRVTFSGYISFLVGIGSLVTGLIFTIIITRQLSVQEYGTWGLIGTILTYVLIFRPVIGFWNTRDVARGIESGRTAFISSGVIGTALIFVYFLLVSIFSDVDFDENLVLFAGILVPLEFVRVIMYTTARAYKPQIEQYGLFIFEISKIAIAAMMIWAFDLGLFGLILTVFFANALATVIVTVNIRDKLKDKFSLDILKRWVKRFWIPLIPNSSQIFNISDVAIFSLLTSSVIGLAYYFAAINIARIPNNAMKISVAVYPKILSTEKYDFIGKNLENVFYFMFPLTALAIVFAKPALFVFNPEYVGAEMLVIILTILVVVRNVGDNFVEQLQGKEKVDKADNATVKEFISSKLFTLPVLRIIQRAGYIVILFFVLKFIILGNVPELDVLNYWALISLICQIPYTGYILYQVRKELSPKINYSVLTKYLIATIIVFSIIYILMENTLEYNESIYVFLPNIIPYVIFVGLMYIGLTYAMDKNTRLLTKLIVVELKSKFKK